MTGPEHTPIREPQSVARLSRTFSQSLSAVDLAEPLPSLDENQPVALGALAAAEQMFIEWRGDVAAVITRRDLQKPPLRVWLFGASTVLAANLTWGIAELYRDDSWQSEITPGRFKKPVELHAERQRRGSACALLNCLQVKDKADILVRDAASFAALGLHSRGEADRFTSDIEKLRNHLAHAQELESEHLATAARLASSIHSIVRAEGAQRIVATRRPAARLSSTDTTP